MVPIHGSPATATTSPLQSLIQWALDEHSRQKREAPARLHSQGNHDDEAVTVSRETIRGLPFSRPFERYLDGHGIRTPARRALEKMHSHSKHQSDEYLVAHALIVRGDASVADRLHPSVVLRSLSTLRTLSEQV